MTAGNGAGQGQPGNDASQWRPSPPQAGWQQGPGVFPGQQTAPYAQFPGAPDPAPKKKRSKTPFVIGGLLLAVLLVFGAVFFLVGSKTPGPAGATAAAAAGNGSLRQVWATPAMGKDADNLVGVWMTDTTVVRIGSTGIAGYDLAGGKQLFTVAAPKPGLVPCFASATVTVTGIGSVFYSQDGNFDCDTVAAINAKTGQVIWTKSADGHSPPSTGSTFVSGSVVVAASDNAVVAGFDAASGNEIWHYTATAGNCHPFDTAGKGAIVLVQETCLNSDYTDSGVYVAVDAATGKRLWKVPAPKGNHLRSVISTEPMVIIASSGTTTLEKGGSELDDHSQFLVFDSSGKQTASIPIPADGSQAASSLSNPVPQALVAGGTLYADTINAKGSSSTVTAFSLASGKQLWVYDAMIDGEISVSTWLVGASPDGKLPLAMATGTASGNPSPVSTLDPGSGKPAQVYALPSETDCQDAFLGAAPNGDVVLVSGQGREGPTVAVFSRK
ncbi:PQQ-binding-like beta-propeller repeat protein [Amycolatopsis rhizosphaerae]|uniref:PQQ-binding-like beta-propeller repeat protein n=1 Tax=Amycolatopsis rhizosphaerae TaxID=2053003 RepID=A0A558A3H0_9PSEU|nr:PQQ-binding-like beta-propeller repeat protein [Amycolatopsis rhizosphaerae]